MTEKTADLCESLRAATLEQKDQGGQPGQRIKQGERFRTKTAFASQQTLGQVRMMNTMAMT